MEGVGFEDFQALAERFERTHNLTASLCCTLVFSAVVDSP